jgi:hypothetical protein
LSEVFNSTNTVLKLFEKNGSFHDQCSQNQNVIGLDKKLPYEGSDM